MTTIRLSIVLFCLIKAHKAAIFSIHDFDKTVPSISGLSSQLSQMTLESGSMNSTGSLLPLFEISEKMNKLIETTLTLDTNTAVKTIEEGLVQILDSGACLHDIAPAIGSFSIEAKELVLAAIENKAYILLRLLQKVYIWRDERQYHWFMALSYDSPWYDKDMWEDPELVPLDWERNLWAVCEVENVALALILRKKAFQRNVLVGFDAKLLSLCIKYDTVKMFELTSLKPAQLKNHFESLARNSAAKLLRLYQTNTGIAHLHLEEYLFPIKLPANVDGFVFLLKNGYNFLPMKKFIKKSCKKGRLDLLKHLYELDSRLIPNLDELRYAAANNFVDILDWGHHFKMHHDFYYNSICETLLRNHHFDTLFWWVDLNKIAIEESTITKIIEFGALKVLQWAIGRQTTGYNFQDVANVAAWNKRISILEWVYETYKVLPTVEFLSRATCEILTWIESKFQMLKGSPPPFRLDSIDQKYEYLVEKGADNFELLRWIFKNAPIYVFDTKREALSKNIKGMEMMLWLHKELNICPFEAGWAYKTGNLEAIKWVIENCGVYPTKQNTEDLIWSGHSEIIIWIHKNIHPRRSIRFDIDLLRYAILHGDLSVAEYLMYNVFPEANEKLSINENVYPDKRLAILKWAHDRGFRFENPGKHVSMAIIYEDLQAFEWLHVNLSVSQPFLNWKLSSAITNDLHRIYRWLMERYPGARKWNELVEDARKARESGSLGILKVIHEKNPSVLGSLPEGNLTKKNYHVYQWLAANVLPVKQIQLELE